MVSRARLIVVIVSGVVLLLIGTGVGAGAAVVVQSPSRQVDQSVVGTIIIQPDNEFGTFDCPNTSLIEGSEWCLLASVPMSNPPLARDYIWHQPNSSEWLLSQTHTLGIHVKWKNGQMQILGGPFDVGTTIRYHATIQTGP